MPKALLQQRLQLYVIPDRALGRGRSLLEQTERALQGGATAIQLRDKQAGGRELHEIACAMKQVCVAHGALLIVNDRLDVALACGADGVHLGHEDLPVCVARAMAPPGFLIGASASSHFERERAESEGADYLGVGAVFTTPTKKDAEWVGLEGLREICAATHLPTVAIGGIQQGNAKEALQAGAGGLAIISAIIAQDDVAAAARAFRQLLD
ncbi:MAG: thiamine-phosphate pyrophosphorylase [Candidatus Sumerlaeota bacterium]|nr:thiamine-phosphate pyrophosphorylase [Candidatus Sumerlaeota bacterium]